MSQYAGMSDADLMAAYKGAKDPFSAALSAEGVSGPLADVARSIYQQESGGGKNTKTSNAGAVGGMQIIPSTFASVADKGWNITDPVQNARAGIRYLKQLDEQSGGDPALTAAGYYGGPGGMEKARKGIAVSDPRNPNAPNTLQYGQQVAARLPQNPIVRGLNAVTDAALPSAQADTLSSLRGMSDADLMAAYQKAKPATAPQPAASAETTPAQDLAQFGKNAVGGFLRGAGSIGATLARPFETGPENADRRTRLDTNAAALLGADPNSWVYKGFKLGGEVAGTAGAGSVLGAGAKVLGASAPVVNALTSAGFTTGAKAAPGMANAATNLAIRSGAGAVVGGASAGVVDPSSAGVGAIVGGAAPGVVGALGYGANKLGQLLSGPMQSDAMRASVKAAQDAGYVVPPTQAKPTMMNRILEGTAGKLTTAQNASAKNQAITNGLAADALGISRDVQLSPQVLSGIRQQAGQAYQAVSSTGMIQPNAAYIQSLDNITRQARTAAAGFPNAKPSPLIDVIETLKSPQFDASSAVSKISELRDSANSAYAQSDKAMGKGLKEAAGVLEDAIDQHLTEISAPADMLKGFREARQLIAKTYSVEKALNPTTGTVDAQKLAAQLAKGGPLSDGLKQAAQFAQSFPKAAQPIEKMGSLPQLSPLDWAAGGGMSAATGNPLMMAAPLIRPVARSLALSPLVQSGLASQPSTNSLAQLLANPGLNQLAYRAAPVAASR